MNTFYNEDKKTVQSFGDEWVKMNQKSLTEVEKIKRFNDYFSIFPLDDINHNSIGFDMGSGSGRWASVVAPKVKRLVCIDASSDAIQVAKENLKELDNIKYLVASVDNTGLNLASFDFGYSLGVLHHVPNTQHAISSCADLLKKDAPFLLYLYYSFDNMPRWYKLIWRLSELIRLLVSRMYPILKIIFSKAFAIVVYFPMARFSYILDKVGLRVDNYYPLSYYRNKSLYTMMTDSRDRFGTPLERRFSQKEIKEMMELSGFRDIKFSKFKPYWVAIAYKK